MWGEAMIAATELLNLMPTSTVLYNGSESPDPKPITPYEAWLGALPSARGIRRWGSRAFLKIVPRPVNKMASRSLELIFVGYNGFTNYRLVDPSNGRLYISKDVVFQENLHAADPSAPLPEKVKQLPSAACQAAAAAPSDPDLFVEETVHPKCPLFLEPMNNWWIDYELTSRIPTFLVQNIPVPDGADLMDSVGDTTEIPPVSSDLKLPTDPGNCCSAAPEKPLTRLRAPGMEILLSRLS